MIVCNLHNNIRYILCPCHYYTQFIDTDMHRSGIVWYNIAFKRKEIWNEKSKERADFASKSK